MKGEKINLIENGKNISNDTELCDIFNGFFSNIISELNIPKKYQCFLNDMDSDSILSVLNAFKNHPSIKNIKSKKLNSTFSFENTYTDVVMKVINNLNVANGKFPDELKHADVIPVHKKNEKCNKTNYRPVSILINISKIYEK